jgi:hypothetical protein
MAPFEVDKITGKLMSYATAALRTKKWQEQVTALRKFTQHTKWAHHAIIFETVFFN